jgi:uncharacterized ferritin-like protein (DUF455 family)
VSYAPLVPPEDTVERWAWEYVLSTSLAYKLAPPPVPTAWEHDPIARRIDTPGRPIELVPAKKRPKTPGANALRDPKRRAELLHTFFHHELQAAELMCRALLLFVDREPAFRRGLLRIAEDEIRHLGMYAAHMRALGHSPGDFPVRDWFWERVPSADDPISFVALFGVGFEGANLDHTQRFAAMFRDAGDVEGARLQEIVGEEEIPHVRFAALWLERWTGALDFEAWRARLPAPLSPIVMRGAPIDRALRRRAGLDDRFVDQLERWQP